MAPDETERELTEKSGETLLRYDNAHESQKDHERHTPHGVEEIHPDVTLLHVTTPDRGLQAVTDGICDGVS